MFAVRRRVVHTMKMAAILRRSLLSCVLALPVVTTRVSAFHPIPKVVSSSVASTIHSQRASSLRSMSSSTPNVIPGRPTFQQVMLRIKDPVKSLKLYTEHLGFTHIDTLDFPQYKFSLYFLTTLPAGETYDLTPGTQAAHDYLWSMEGVALELTHNHGTESQEGSTYHAGNQEKDGAYGKWNV